MSILVTRPLPQGEELVAACARWDACLELSAHRVYPGRQLLS